LEEKNGIVSGVIDLYKTKSKYSSGNIFLNHFLKKYLSLSSSLKIFNISKSNFYKSKKLLKYDDFFFKKKILNKKSISVKEDEFFLEFLSNYSFTLSGSKYQHFNIFGLKSDLYVDYTFEAEKNNYKVRSYPTFLKLLKKKKVKKLGPFDYCFLCPTCLRLIVSKKQLNKPNCEDKNKYENWKKLGEIHIEDNKIQKKKYKKILRNLSSDEVLIVSDFTTYKLCISDFIIIKIEKMEDEYVVTKFHLLSDKKDELKSDSKFVINGFQLILKNIKQKKKLFF
jgi:hypothetical protein